MNSVVFCVESKMICFSFTGTKVCNFFLLHHCRQLTLRFSFFPHFIGFRSYFSSIYVVFQQIFAIVQIYLFGIQYNSWLMSIKVDIFAWNLAIFFSSFHISSIRAFILLFLIVKFIRYYTFNAQYSWMLTRCSRVNSHHFLRRFFSHLFPFEVLCSEAVQLNTLFSSSCFRFAFNI